MTNTPKYWASPVPSEDDFGEPIFGAFIDGRTLFGPWATMTPSSWLRHGMGKLGEGLGQRYEKQEDGRWLKVE